MDFNITKDNLKMKDLFPGEIYKDADEVKTPWRYKAMKAQQAIKATLGKLFDTIEEVHNDIDLTPAGRAKRYAVKGKEALAELDRIEQSLAFAPLVKRLSELENLMTTKTREETMQDVMREIEMRQYLMKDFGDGDLIGLLNQAIDAGDAICYRAIVNIPKIFARRYMLTESILADARRRWGERQNPENAVEYSELYAIVQNLKTSLERVRQNIFETCGISDLRKYTEAERQALESAAALEADSQSRIGSHNRYGKASNWQPTPAPSVPLTVKNYDGQNVLAG